MFSSGRACEGRPEESRPDRKWDDKPEEILEIFGRTVGEVFAGAGAGLGKQGLERAKVRLGDADLCGSSSQCKEQERVVSAPILGNCSNHSDSPPHPSITTFCSSFLALVARAMHCILLCIMHNFCPNL